MAALTSSRAEALVAHVEGMIARDKLAPGARIATRTELRAQTGLANATISEGIRLLQERGLVTVRPGPGGGLFAAEMPPMVRLGQSLLAVRGQSVTVADTVVVRDALEPLIAAEAARYRNDDDITDLRADIERMAERVGDPSAFLKANWRLHRRIATICRNEVLRTMYHGLATVIEDQVAGIMRASTSEEHSRYKQQRLQLHRDLVDAIVRGDERTAARLGRAHAEHLHS